MTKKKRPARTRTLRRDLERIEHKLGLSRRKLIALEPGGSPERPIVVESAAVVERRAESVPCPDCEGSMRASEHNALTHQGVLLREVSLTCRSCGGSLLLFFRIVTPLAN